MQAQYQLGKKLDIQINRNQSFRSKFFLITLALLCNLNLVKAQNLPPVDASSGASFTVKFTSSPRFGEYLKLAITLKLNDGWSVYGLHPSTTWLTKTSIQDNLSGLLAVTPWYETNTQDKEIKSIGQTLFVHKSGARFYKNYQVTNAAKDGTYPIIINYQACNDKICLLPAEYRLYVKLNIEPGKAREAFSTIDRQIDSIPTIGGLFNESSGLVQFILLAMGLGLLTLISPCVLPMIPLTINYFNANSGKNGEKAKSSALLIIYFIPSIAICYSLLGLLITAIWGAAGLLDILASPIVNLIFAIAFIILALSYVGIFKIPLPGKLIAKLDSLGKNYSIGIKTIFIGISFAVCSFSCNIQLIGALLVLAAAGNYLWPFIGMSVYALALSVPLALIGFVPSLFKKIKGGNWQQDLQWLLAILLIIGSLRFIINYQQIRSIIYIDRNGAILLILGLLLVFLIASLYNFFKYKSIKVQQLQICIWLVVAGSIIYIGKGYNNYSLGGYVDALLPSVKESEHLQGGEFIDDSYPKLLWLADKNDALNKAGAENKMTLVYFSAYSCVNCRWMEQYILQKINVYQELKNYQLLKLYTDSGAAYKENQNWQISDFKSVALPFFAILDKDRMIIKQHAGIFDNPQEFIEFLSQ